MPNSDVSGHNETSSENIFGVSLLPLIFINNIDLVLTQINGENQTGKKHFKHATKKNIVFLVWGESREILVCRLVFKLHRRSRVLILSLGVISMNECSARLMWDERCRLKLFCA